MFPWQRLTSWQALIQYSIAGNAVNCQQSFSLSLGLYLEGQFSCCQKRDSRTAVGFIVRRTRSIRCGSRAFWELYFFSFYSFKIIWFEFQGSKTYSLQRYIEVSKNGTISAHKISSYFNLEFADTNPNMTPLTTNVGISI